MSSTIDHEKFSKQERILNALAVYPERYQMSNQVMADLTDASTSYVYQLRTALDEGTLPQEDIEAALHDGLQSHYRERLGDLLQEYDVDRSINEVQNPKLEETQITPETGPVAEDSTVSAEAVREVRETMAQYRADSDEEAASFQGPAADTAAAKSLMARRAVALLDQILKDEQSVQRHLISE